GPAHTLLISFITSLKKRYLLSPEFPPYLSVLLFVNGDKNSLIKYPWAPCNSTTSNPACLDLQAANLKLPIVSFISEIVISSGFLASSLYGIGDGATIGPSTFVLLPASHICPPIF